MKFWQTEYNGNTVLDYFIVVGIVLGSLILGKLIFILSRKVFKKLAANTKTKLDDILLDKCEAPIVYGLVLTATWYSLNRLNFPTVELSTADVEAGLTIAYSHTKQFINHLFTFLAVINVTWLIARLTDALIEEYILPMVEKTESDLDDQLMPIFRKGLKVIIWVLGIIVGLNNSGYDVGAVIAGLGIGGLAFALAAQDTVKNFFGGIMLFVDKPFKVGERIQIGSIDGVVREIGLRSTRIVTLAGRVVTVPNSMFSDDAVENVDLEPSRKITLNLGLTYDMSADKIEHAMQILRDIVKENENCVEENISIGFDTFGDFSLGILFIYFIKKGEDNLGVQTLMNLAILRRFGEEGLEMAFPTQTIYHQGIK